MIVQDEAQHMLLLPDLAAAVVAAVQAGQVPEQDLAGCQQFDKPTQQASSGNARPAVAGAFARLVLQMQKEGTLGQVSLLCLLTQ